MPPLKHAGVGRDPVLRVAPSVAEGIPGLLRQGKGSREEGGIGRLRPCPRLMSAGTGRHPDAAEPGKCGPGDAAAGNPWGEIDFPHGSREGTTGGTQSKTQLG